MKNGSGQPQPIHPHRQSSPSCSGDAEVDADEEGGHDTITSLAGVKMMQKYKRTISGQGFTVLSHVIYS